MTERKPGGLVGNVLAACKLEEPGSCPQTRVKPDVVVCICNPRAPKVSETGWETGFPEVHGPAGKAESL